MDIGATDADSLTNAARVVMGVGDLTAGFHPDHHLAREAVVMHLVLTHAVTTLQAMAVLLAKGHDRDEAMHLVLVGDIPLPAHAVSALTTGARLSRH